MKKEFKDAIGILKLDKNKMSKVAGRSSATKMGIFFLFLPLVLNLLLASWTFSSGFGSVFSKFYLWPLVIPTLGLIASFFVMTIVSEKYFSGSADHVGFFRIMAYGAVILWVAVFAFALDAIGIIYDAGEFYNLLWYGALIWLYYVAYSALIVHQKLDGRDALLAVASGFLGFIVVNYILGKTLVGSYYHFFYLLFSEDALTGPDD